MKFTTGVGLLLLLAPTPGVSNEIKLTAANVHWGTFSKEITPVLTIASGDEVTVEMATHHACDDFDLMIKGDEAMEDIFNLMHDSTVDDFNIPEGAGDGVHILTGPIFVTGAEPGDILKVEILNLEPRRNAAGRIYGSSASGWWGYQARWNKVDNSPFRARSKTRSGDATDETVTIFEIVQEGAQSYAVPSYMFTWPTVLDPKGGKRDYMKYPGTCVPHDAHGSFTPSGIVNSLGWTKEGNIQYYEQFSISSMKIPVQYHIGCMGLAPGSHESVDSTPPMVTGGNLDNRRIGMGTTMYYPVEGGLTLYSELSGSGIETSLTGRFRISVIKQADFTAAQETQNFPLAETDDEWIVHGFTKTNYLETFGDNPDDVFKNPDDLSKDTKLGEAMSNVFLQARKWMMAEYSISDLLATTIITQGCDFAVTQLVNGNWGMHVIIPKAIFSGRSDSIESQGSRRRLQEADLKLSADTVHWGYFSYNKDEPVLTINSGAEIVVEMATHHACDDFDLMIAGDEGMENIFHWSTENKNEPFRGATSQGDGVHILTGPIFVNGAEPGDVLQVDILDLEARSNPQGKKYGSNAAAWWGYQARVAKVDETPFTAGAFTGTPGENDEFVTIYEIVTEPDGMEYAIPVYQFEWVNITDPEGIERDYIAYPGTCVPHDAHGSFVPSGRVAAKGWSKKGNITYHDNLFPAKIPVQYHVGCMGLAPSSHSIVDSIPPMVTGGNLDNRRIGIGTTMYYPVQVTGAYLSMGDAHSAQADSELDGTGIETSITGKFKVTVLKKDTLKGGLVDLNFPLGETEDTWIVHGFTKIDYLAAFPGNPADIYSASDVDETMMNAYKQTRKFLMAEYGMTEKEAWTVISQGVNFGITQVVDGNWGIHGIIPKAMLASVTPPRDTSQARLLAPCVSSLIVMMLMVFY